MELKNKELNNMELSTEELTSGELPERLKGISIQPECPVCHSKMEFDDVDQEDGVIYVEYWCPKDPNWKAQQEIINGKLIKETLINLENPDAPGNLIIKEFH